MMTPADGQEGTDMEAGLGIGDWGLGHLWFWRGRGVGLRGLSQGGMAGEESMGAGGVSVVE
jgi:hypothetical protein